MTHPQRGAAQVSLMWIIALGVIFLFTALFAFLSQSQLSDVQDQLDAQVQKTAAETAKFGEKVAELTEISSVVGITDGTTGARTNPSMVRTEIENIENIFPSVKPGTATLEAALPGMIADYRGMLQQYNDQKNQAASLRNDLAARQQEINNVKRSLEDSLNSVRRELEDTRNSLNTQVTDLERQRDGSRSQIRTLEDEKSALTVSNEEALRSLQNKLQVTEDRMGILSDRLNGVERGAEQPDGTMVAVSEAVMQGYIDRGRLDRIRAGMQFEVLDPKGETVKGRVEVRRVEERRAEVKILSQTDRFSPILAGDLIRNAVYDPSRQPIAVLLGNGFGTYSESDMRNLLAEVGFEVRSEVDREADFLILGTPFFDPDTGDRVPFESRDEYKAAEAYAVQILPLRDVQSWLGI